MLNKEKPVKLEIDKDKCTLCGTCVKFCAGEYLLLEDNSIKPNINSIFGCTQCGNCMMNCPDNAIKITAEGFSENDIIEFNSEIPDFNAVKSLFLRRRSVRKFKKQEVPQEIIDKILQAAATAPMSIPPSEVKVLVVNGFDKVQELAFEADKRFNKFSKVMNPFVLGLFKPFIGNNKYKLMKDFISPLMKLLCEKRKDGVDFLFYNAPAVLLFYGTEVSMDNTDQIIAATYADIAAQSLGLGTCIIGSVPPVFDDRLKAEYGISKNEKIGIAFILGYPEIKFKRGIRRKFNAVNYI